MYCVDGYPPIPSMTSPFRPAVIYSFNLVSSRADPVNRVSFTIFQSTSMFKPKESRDIRKFSLELYVDFSKSIPRPHLAFLPQLTPSKEP